MNVNNPAPASPDPVTVVIRSSHERTEKLCKKLILDQKVQKENLFLIHETPFSAAMRKSFEIGIDRGLPWTCCVDADLLLRPGSISKMVALAESKKERVCEIQGYILDKFFGGVRKGGLHLYRTSLLPEVLQCIPEEGVNIRPERHTLGKMKEAGYPWETVPYITAIHDDEQFNRDIYRKAFVQAVKHVDRAELFITLWKEKSLSDPDFKVALKGFADSIQTHDAVYIDKSQKLYDDLFEQSGFSEKPELDTNLFTLEQVEETVKNWVSPDIYFTYFPSRDGLDSAMTGGRGRIKRSLKERGLVKTGALVLSKLFLKAANRIRPV